jgi:molybdenum cofactor biosynthesis enzyme MoaA
MPGSPPLRAVLKLTYQCNSRCRFCRVEAFRDAVADVPRAEVGRKMAAARARGVGMILFSGGEPTLRNDLPLLARAATALGLRWGLITNGRRLAHPAYRQALLDLGLAYVHTSLHGATAARHDDLVQCASFDEVMTALAGLAGTGVELHVNTVVTRPNVAELGAIGDLLAPFAPLTHKLCLAEPRGLFDTYATQLMVPPQQAGRAASEAVARARTRHGAAGLETVVEGFPLCQIPSALDAVANLRTHNIRYMSEGFEDDLFPTDHGDREYPAPCDDCAMRDACPGVYPGYVRRFGVIGLRAFRRTR